MSVRDELCGRTVGEFVLRERIGEGAYGAVYRAEQPLLGREAVIKVLHGKLRARHVMIQRFLREARLASRLDHPYAAHVYAFGVEKDDGLLWIAMEMVHGTPFDRWLHERGSLSLADLVPFFERIAEVVQTGHERGIVHRDLKPSNVMVVERAGRLLPKLLDFGIAKLLLEEDPTEAAQLLLDQAQVDAASDAAAANEPTAPAAPIAPAEPAPAPAAPQRVPKTGTLTATATMPASDPAVPLESELTALGTALGSPPYMAPEQWTGESVGPRADLYSLGVLAYEALTGRRPFTATTMAELADLHADQPVPPLGGDHPPALDRFFERALAKRPLDRPASALELAAALRVAAGLAEDPAELPRLERGVHDAWIADAPQPLAEAVAVLEGARNPHQARDAALDLFRTLVRYLLALALASRAQVREGRLDPEADALLRELGRRALDDAERIRLMRRLVRSLADQRGAHPLPPLVDLLVPREGTDDALEPLLRLEGATDPRGPRDELVRSHLAQLVLALGRLLRAASFVLDYRLAVVRAGACESWMGLPRARRRLATIRGPASPEGQPSLLDGDGRSVLVLWPLAQLAPPVPGTDDEVFLFDGPDRRGARLVAGPRGFELHDPTLWDWLGEHAFTHSEDITGTSPEDRAPYLGLEAFSAADADRFVGREREVDSLSNRLRTTALQIVVGASGAGKSSFVHAGLVPTLPPGGRVVSMRPGSRPVATLATRLAAAGLSTVEVSMLLDGTVSLRPATAPRAIVSVPRSSPLGRPITAPAMPDGGEIVPLGALTVIVDQLEELFTLCRSETERERFAAALDALSSAPDGRSRVICTLRDDFLMRAAALPVLGSRLAGSVFFLGNPSREELIRTIVEPARRAGYELSDAELAPEMSDAVAGRPGALALLSFTASRLWELRDRQFHRLTRRAYEAMGGVGGALGQHAEATIEALGAEDRRLVREAFRHLVTAEGTRAQLSKAELEQVLASPNAGAVIDRLVGARLLVIADHEDGTRVEIVHEALLGAWPRVQQWVREDADSARMRDQVRSAARQWDERGRARGLLWRDEALAELERWRRRYAEQGLTSVERAFADASRTAAVHGRRVRRLALIAAFAVLGVALAVMFWLRGEATRQRALADMQAREMQERLVGSYVERGQQALLGDNVEPAISALEAAHRMGERTPAVEFMLARARESSQAELSTFRGHVGQVWNAAFSPDGGRIISSGQDAVVRVWDPATARELLALPDHVPPVVSAWTPGGEMVTADAAGAIRVWTAEGRVRASLSTGAGVSTRISFSPDGARFALSRTDGDAVIIDTATGAQYARWKADEKSLEVVVFDPTGERVATASYSGKAAVWSLEGKQLASFVGHTSAIWEAGFDAQGERLVTASLDHTAIVWDAKTGKQLHKLLGHEDRVTALAVDGPSRRIATGSSDTTVRLWNLDTGAPLGTLRSHTGQVNAILFVPGEQLVSSSTDGTARVWDLVHNVPTAVYHHAGALRRFGIDPAGRRMVTASWAGSARVWDLRRQSRVQMYASPLARPTLEQSLTLRTMVEAGRLVRFGARGAAGWDLVTSRPWEWSASKLVTGALSADGRLAVVATAAGELLALDAVEGRLLYRIGNAGADIQSVVAYPDGRRAATCSADGTVTLWDLATERQLEQVKLGKVSSLRLSRDARTLLAFYSADERPEGAAAAWLLAGDLSRTVPLAHVAGLFEGVFSPDSTHLVTLSQDGTAGIWTLDGRLETTLRHSAPVLTAAWSSNGSWLATGTTAGMLTIWDRPAWTARKAIEAHVSFITTLAIDDKNNLIASGGGDGVVKVWDATLLQLARFPTGKRVFHLAFERDRLLVSGELATQAWRCDQ